MSHLCTSHLILFSHASESLKVRKPLISGTGICCKFQGFKIKRGHFYSKRNIINKKKKTPIFDKTLAVY